MAKAKQKPETADEFIARTGCLRRFIDGQRVVVIDEEHPLHDQEGRVVRICVGGVGPWSQSGDGTFWNIPQAWVRFDQRTDGVDWPFAENDPRGRNLKMDAWQMRAASQGGADNGA